MSDANAPAPAPALSQRQPQYYWLWVMCLLGVDYFSTLAVMADAARTWGKDHVGETITAFWTEQLIVTVLLGIVGFVFWWVLRNGFNRNVLVWAVPVVGLFLLLNGIIIFTGLQYLIE